MKTPQSADATHSDHFDRHDHVFLGHTHARNERRTWLVIALTAAMMVAEISAGTIFGSMALVADGWHMATHAAALLIAALAYRFARRHAHNARFTFGTGKMGDLAGFASATVLAVVAVLIGWESLQRLAEPVAIDFSQALLVAVVGLAVNVVCAWLLHEGHPDHHHDHHADYEHHHREPHEPHDHHEDAHPAHGGGQQHRPVRDNNLRAAYMHVLADALTSVLAIAALLAGGALGWLWLDPLIGIVGAVVIAVWSQGLIRDTGKVLLDYLPDHERLPAEIRSRLEDEHTRVTDLHVWRLGPGHHGAIVSIAAAAPAPLARYKDRLTPLSSLSHLTIEVHAASDR